MEKIKIAMDSDIVTAGRKDIRSLISKLQNMGDIFEIHVASDNNPTVTEKKDRSTDLYLSSSKEITAAFNSMHIPSCYIDLSKEMKNRETVDSSIITFAFDCDGVLFDSEAEDVYREYGLEVFNGYEYANRNKEMNPGPFYKIVKKLNKVKKHDDRIKLVACTARSYPATERAMFTFDIWNIDFDAIFFCGSNSKGAVLKSLDTDIFFDDTESNICDAVKNNVLAGQVV